MKPLVSVVIPTYNGASYIREAVDSALAQKYQPLEVIVVDDGSTDNTEDVLKPVMGRIRYIKKANGGPAGARNAGIKEAKGEFIAFLDGDDVWEPHKLTWQMPAFENANVGLAYANVSVMDEGGNPLEHTIRLAKSEGLVFEDLFRKNFIPTSTVVARKSCIEKAGYFDENRELISVEDYDLWLKIAANHRVRRVDMVLAKYRRHPHNISTDLARSYFGEKKVLENALKTFGDRFPLIRKQWKRRLGCLWHELTRDYFYRGDYAHAKKYCVESFRNDPWNPRNFRYYLLLLLGSGVINGLKKIRNPRS